MATTRLCSIPDCDKPATKRGWCQNHWWRWRKHGSPLGGGTTRGEPLRYLKDVILAYDGDECLIWPFGKITGGYGVIHINGENCFVHRMVCEVVNGPVPTPKHDAAHSCGKGHLGCVTKKHLSWKTRRENLADMIEHGTARRGEVNGNSKLTEADVVAIRSMQGKTTQADLAQRFDVSPSLISGIQSRKKWSWLE